MLPIPSSTLQQSFPKRKLPVNRCRPACTLHSAAEVSEEGGELQLSRGLRAIPSVCWGRCAAAGRETIGRRHFSTTRLLRRSVGGHSLQDGEVDVHGGGHALLGDGPCTLLQRPHCIDDLSEALGHLAGLLSRLAHRAAQLGEAIPPLAQHAGAVRQLVRGLPHGAEGAPEVVQESLRPLEALALILGLPRVGVVAGQLRGHLHTLESRDGGSI